jgi:hypothetical protein
MVSIDYGSVFNIVLDNGTFGFLEFPVVSNIDESPFLGFNITKFKFNNIILGSLLDSEGICV